MITFECIYDGKPYIGSKGIEVNIFFDIKYMTLTNKVRLVPSAHKAEVPNAALYSSVVSREKIRLAFLDAALNDLEVKDVCQV